VSSQARNERVKQHQDHRAGEKDHHPGTLGGTIDGYVSEHDRHASSERLFAGSGVPLSPRRPKALLQAASAERARHGNRNHPGNDDEDVPFDVELGGGGPW
jgi:hypothetical protein